MHDEKYRPIIAVIEDDLSTAETQLADLNRQLSTLQSQANKLSGEVSELQRQRDFWYKRLGIEREVGYQDDDGVASTHEVQSQSNANREPHAEVAKRILLHAGEPLSTTEIVRRMAEINHPLPQSSSSRHNAIYSAMTRRKHEFILLGKGFWGLVGRDEALPKNAPEGHDAPRD